MAIDEPAGLLQRGDTAMMAKVRQDGAADRSHKYKKRQDRVS